MVHEQRRKRRPCQITMSAWIAQAPLLGETVGEIPMPLMVQLVDGKMARMVTIDREAADEAIAGDARRMMRASFYFCFILAPCVTLAVVTYYHSRFMCADVHNLFLVRP